MKVIHLVSKIHSVEKADGDDRLKITGYASTMDKDRVGDTILPSAWMNGGLDNYKKNPIILLNHNYSAPIGRTEEIEVDGNGLKITSFISSHAGPTYGLVKDGVLSTFSVGFMVKDADYDQVNDGYIIKDAELLEVSVVSVPCNQDACFSLAKALGSQEELEKFKKELHIDIPGQIAAEANGSDAESPGNGQHDQRETLEMDPELLQKMAEEAAAKMIAKRDAEAEIARKAASEKAAAEAETTRAVTEAVTAASASILATAEEKLMAEFEKRMASKEESFEKTFGELKGELEAKSEELQKMNNSKRTFVDRNGGSGDVLKEFMPEIEDAYLLGRITKKGYETDFAKNLLEKVNAHSTVTVGSAAFETSVSQNIERDIQNDLILAPMFREIRMTNANMTIPIMPDAGYAEITANTAASGTQPNGNMDTRGAPFGAPYEGLTLTEISLNTIKMIAKSYLGNETEEDAIIPILPLIREAMIRTHVRGVENMILAGNDVDGVYTSGAKDGLIKLARSNGRMVTAAGTATPLTAATLFGMRKLMGKYGLRADDIVYIVSQTAYFELIEDAEFQDADLVGVNNATKLTGTVGRLYGSQVVMCDEFAAPAAGKFYALALNRRNFVVPRLRGVTVESEYSVENQRQVLVTSQRLGFNEMIPNATSVVGLRYALV